MIILFMRPAAKNLLPRKQYTSGNTNLIVVLIVGILLTLTLIGGLSRGYNSVTRGSQALVTPPSPEHKSAPLQLVLYNITLTPTPGPPSLVDACPTLNIDLSTVSQSVNYYCDGEAGLVGEPNTLYACVLPLKQTAGSVICQNGCTPGGDHDSECNGPGPSGDNLTCNYCRTSGFFYQCTKPGSATICANYDDALNSYYPQGYSCGRCY